MSRIELLLGEKLIPDHLPGDEVRVHHLLNLSEPGLYPSDIYFKELNGPTLQVMEIDEDDDRKDPLSLYVSLLESRIDYQLTIDDLRSVRDYRKKIKIHLAHASYDLFIIEKHSNGVTLVGVGHTHDV